MMNEGFLAEVTALRNSKNGLSKTAAQALGYQIGNLKFRELRARAEQQLGERFDVRAYHDQLMAAGPVTLPVLEAVVDDWIDRALH